MCNVLLTIERDLLKTILEFYVSITNTNLRFNDCKIYSRKYVERQNIVIEIVQ